MSRVLLVGDDPVLLETRAALLRQACVAEIICCCSALALAAQAEKECDLVVLGHSLRPEMCAALVEGVRKRWPQTRILLLTPLGQWIAHTPLAVDGVSSTEPDRLINRAAELLRVGRDCGTGSAGGPGRRPPASVHCAQDLSVGGGFDLRKHRRLLQYAQEQRPIRGLSPL